MLLKYGIKCGGYQRINDIGVIILEIPETIRVSIKELKKICCVIRNNNPDVEPLFIYNRINGMQRKSILQTDISFAVKGKELHIVKSKERV